MKQFLLSLPLFLLCFSCADDDDTLIMLNDCGESIFITDQPSTFPNDDFAIANATVEGLCLTVNVSGNGCTPEAWTAELRTDGSIAESLPTQSSATLWLDDGLPDGSPCLALSFKEFSFDLAPYLGEGALPTFFSIRNGNDSTLVTLSIEE